jgi:hypothetical protein
MYLRNFIFKMGWELEVVGLKKRMNGGKLERLVLFADRKSERESGYTKQKTAK